MSRTPTAPSSVIVVGAGIAGLAAALRLTAAGVDVTVVDKGRGVGGRLAIAAIVPTQTGPICVVSTHLESNADAAHRCAQMDHLLREIDDFAPGLPVLIGGDLNTGNALPPRYDWRDETLFGLAEWAGYDWGFTADGMSTRASLITRHPQRQMKLDWIAGRDLACTDKGCAPALGPDGTPLSDHDCVWCRARRA